jgi:prophage regulatory protein
MAQQAIQGAIRWVTKEQAQQAASHAYTAPADDRLITDREVAHLLGASRSWVWMLTRDGKLPAPIKLSQRCTRWRLAQVREWMADPLAWQAANGEDVQ